MEICGKIVGKDFNLSIKDVNISGKMVENLVEKIAEKLIDSTKSLAAAFLQKMSEVVGRFKNEIKASATEIANSAEKAYKESEEALAEAMSSIGNYRNEAGKKIQDFGERSLKVAESAAKNLYKGIRKLLGG